MSFGPVANPFAVVLWTCGKFYCLHLLSAFAECNGNHSSLLGFKTVFTLSNVICCMGKGDICPLKNALKILCRGTLFLETMQIIEVEPHCSF